MEDELQASMLFEEQPVYDPDNGFVTGGLQRKR